MPSITACALALVLAVVALLAGGGCATTSTADNSPPLPTGTWTLAAIRGEPLASIEPLTRLPTLEIGPDGGVSGFGGVNRFRGGALTLTGPRAGTFSPGKRASTLMAGPPGATRVEVAYSAALDDAVRANLRDNELLLVNSAGDEVLRFTR